MKFNKLYIKKTFCVLTSSIIILSMSGCVKEENISEENEVIIQSIDDIVEENIIEKNNNTESNIVEYTDNDMKVINELNNLENKLDEILNSETVTNIKEISKEYFITTVDFIFYNGEIKGITFDELSNNGKEKVLSIAYSIDNKIEDKFPNYKETISSVSNEFFTKASELIKKGKSNIEEFSKEKLGDKYDEFIEAKDEVSNSTKESLDKAIDITKDTYEKGKEYIKNWYNEFKK